MMDRKNTKKYSMNPTRKKMYKNLIKKYSRNNNDDNNNDNNINWDEANESGRKRKEHILIELRRIRKSISLHRKLGKRSELSDILFNPKFIILLKNLLKTIRRQNDVMVRLKYESSWLLSYFLYMDAYYVDLILENTNLILVLVNSIDTSIEQPDTLINILLCINNICVRNSSYRDIALKYNVHTYLVKNYLQEIKNGNVELLKKYIVTISSVFISVYNDDIPNDENTIYNNNNNHNHNHNNHNNFIDSEYYSIVVKVLQSYKSVKNMYCRKHICGILNVMIENENNVQYLKTIGCLNYFANCLRRSTKGHFYVLRSFGKMLSCSDEVCDEILQYDIIKYIFNYMVKYPNVDFIIAECCHIFSNIMLCDSVPRKEKIKIINKTIHYLSYKPWKVKREIYYIILGYMSYGYMDDCLTYNYLHVILESLKTPYIDLNVDILIDIYNILICCVIEDDMIMYQDEVFRIVEEYKNAFDGLYHDEDDYISSLSVRVLKLLKLKTQKQ